MALATLSIDLVARLASFEKDLGLAARAAEKSAASITGAFTKVGTVVSAVLGSAAVGGLALMVRASVDAVDAFNDLKDATGASIENISALDRLARETGQTFENVSGILIKFNRALADADDKNDAGRVFKALNLDVEKLRQMDPAEALRTTALAMNSFAREGDLARATQVLFSRSVQDAAPFLKDLAEKGELVATTTTKQAEEAEKFNKELSRLKANADDAARSIANELVPALNKLFDKYKENGGGLSGILGLFGFDKKFSESAALYDKVMAMKSLQKQIAQRETDLQRGQGFFGTPEQVEAELANLRPAFEKAKKEFNDLYAATRGYQLNSTAGAGRGSINPEFVKPQLVVPGEAKNLKIDPAIERGKELALALTAQSAALSPDFYKKWEDLGVAYKAGAISLEKLTDAQALLLKQQPFMKAEVFLGDIDSDALSRKLADLEAVRKGIEDMNTELDKMADGGDSRKRALTAQLEARLNAGEVFSPEQLERMVLGIGGVSKGLAETRDIAGDFASVFESGFEKAILKGEKLGTVLKSLGMDIIQIGLRTAITQPLGKMAGNWFAGVLSSLLPSFDVGTASVPYDMVAKIHKGERIIPARQNKPGAMGSTTVIIQNTIGSVASKSDVVAGMQTVRAQIVGQLSRSRQYGGAFA